MTGENEQKWLEFLLKANQHNFDNIIKIKWWSEDIETDIMKKRGFKTTSFKSVIQESDDNRVLNP